MPLAQARKRELCFVARRLALYENMPIAVFPQYLGIALLASHDGVTTEALYVLCPLRTNKGCLAVDALHPDVRALLVIMSFKIAFSLCIYRLLTAHRTPDCCSWTYSSMPGQLFISHKCATIIHFATAVVHIAFEFRIPQPLLKFRGDDLLIGPRSLAAAAPIFVDRVKNATCAHKCIAVRATHRIDQQSMTVRASSLLWHVAKWVSSRLYDIDFVIADFMLFPLNGFKEVRFLLLDNFFIFSNFLGVHHLVIGYVGHIGFYAFRGELPADGNYVAWATACQQPI